MNLHVHNCALSLAILVLAACSGKFTDSTETTGASGSTISSDAEALLPDINQANQEVQAEPAPEPIPDKPAVEPTMIAGGYLACFQEQSVAEGDPNSGRVGCGVYSEPEAKNKVAVPENYQLLKVGFRSPDNRSGELSFTAVDDLDQSPFHWLINVSEVSVGYLIDLYFDGTLIPESSNDLTLFSAVVRGVIPPAFMSAGVDYSLRVASTQECMSGNPDWGMFLGVPVTKDMQATSCENNASFAVNQHENGSGLRISTYNATPLFCGSLIAEGYCYRSCISYIPHVNSSKFGLFGCSVDSSVIQDFEFETVEGSMAARIKSGTRYLMINGSQTLVTEDPELATKFELLVK